MMRCPPGEGLKRRTMILLAIDYGLNALRRLRL